MLFCVCLGYLAKANNGTDSLALVSLMEQTASELYTIEQEWKEASSVVSKDLFWVNHQLDSFNMITTPTEYLWALNRKIELRDK